MPPLEFPQLPFLTREMLKFGPSASFALEVSSTSNVVENIIISGVTREGPFSFSFVTNGNGVIESQTFQIPDIPISVSTNDKGLAVSAGTVFMTIAYSINGDIMQQLCSGYVYNTHHITYPAASLEHTRLGGGLVEVVTGANPATGAEIAHTVPAGQMWRLMAIRFTLVTDGTAATRVVHLVFGSSGVPVLDIIQTGQPASTTRNYSTYVSGGLRDNFDDDDHLADMPPDFFLRPGSTITTETTLIEAGDDFGAPRFLIERFVD